MSARTSAEAALHTYPDSTGRGAVLQQLDAASIDINRSHGRHESHFAYPAYARLKESIRHCGQNEVPVLVRRRSAGRFELVYGRCRHQAATELGLPLVSLVKDAADMNDLDALRVMAVESEWGSPWSIYERGTMLRRCLDWGAFPSTRHAADSLRWRSAEIHKALIVVAWPTELLSAFPSPVEVKETWVTPLNEALIRNSNAVLSVAAEFSAGRKRGTATGVYKALLAATA